MSGRSTDSRWLLAIVSAVTLLNGRLGRHGRSQPARQAARKRTGEAPPRRAAAQTRLRRHGPAMSERDDAGCWLPIIGLCITIPVWRPL
jgi:hypothetical protein